jgi:hypothetical protein
MEDMSKLIENNNELNEVCKNMDEEVTYLKFREKKLMYLVHLL